MSRDLFFLEKTNDRKCPLLHATCNMQRNPLLSVNPPCALSSHLIVRVDACEFLLESLAACGICKLHSWQWMRHGEIKKNQMEQQLTPFPFDRQLQYLI